MAGFLPFYSEDKEITMTYCITGDYLLHGCKIFEDLSDEVKDLIQGLLKVDPYERYDYEQILNHDWFRSNKNSKINCRKV